MKELKQEMIKHILCYHKNMKDYLHEDISYEKLLPLCHPGDRERFDSKHRKVKKDSN